MHSASAWTEPNSVESRRKRGLAAGRASIVVTDLDGTLWDHHCRAPNAHLQALERLTGAGVPILLATARGPRSASKYLTRNCLGHLPLVCLDGAIGLEPDGARFEDRAFSFSSAVAALEIFSDFGLDPCVGVFDELSDQVVSDAPTTCRGHLEYLGPWKRSGDLSEITRDTKIYGMSILGLPRASLHAVAAEFSANANCHTSFAEDPHFGGWSLRIRPSGINKWTATNSYCVTHAIDPSNAVAVGDGENDVSLLRASVLALVVRDGHPAALAEATHLIPTVNEEGWASVPEIALGEPQPPSDAQAKL